MSRKRWSAVVLAAGLLLVFLLLFPCLQKIRNGERWVYSANSLRQIGYAFQSYHEVNEKLPPAAIRGEMGQDLLSWRVAILPYIEQDILHKQFRLDESWDSHPNKPLSETTPRCYVPVFGGSDNPGLTRYQVLVGPGTAFERPGLTWTDFSDGRGSTLLIAEAEVPVVWSKPVDMAYNPAGPLPRLGAGYTKPVHFLCREVNRHPGFVACFADGSARFIRGSTDESVVRALITRNGGEPVDVFSLD